MTPRYACYSDALIDPRWHRKANLAKHRVGFRCEECAAPGALDAHHCYYDRQNHPWEYPIYAIRVLCRSCHKEREHAENYLKLQLSTCNLAGLWRTAQELERTRIGGDDLA